LALSLVLGITITSYRTWAAYGRQFEQEAITQNILADANALLSSLKDAETGQRGFLLTGEDRYLSPYRKALEDVPVILGKLRQATATRPDQMARVAKLEPLVTNKLDELKQTIGLRQSDGLQAALTVVRSDRGMEVMDGLRQSCLDIQTASRARLALYAGQSKTAADELGLISTLGSMVLFLLLGFSTFTIHNGTRRRYQLFRELQKSQEQTAEARDWLQVTLGSIGDAVIATDSGGNITFLNRVAEALTGWRSEQAVGKPLQQVFVIHNEETGAEVENPVSKALREDRIVGLANHTRLTARDGRQIPIDDSAAPIRDAGGKIIGVVLVFRDVTERAAAEDAEKQAAAAAVRHAELLERTNAELRQFAYGASHDLREPLRTINVYSEMLKRDGDIRLNEKNAEYLGFIAASARRMSQLVDALMEYSMAGEAAGDSHGLVKMDEVLRTTLENLSGSISESQAVITFDGLPGVAGDEVYLGQLVQNLIGNALKYRREDAPRIHVSARKQGEEWVFSIADNGQGIAAPYQAQVFNLFARLHGQNYPGSGIGLATCRRIVERYGGRIWVESEENRGSTFYFTLPVKEITAASR
jgi:PAS domain S-box-containing protein